MSTEYQVRPVTRYVVTRYEATSNQDGSQVGAASSVIGEFANGHIADDVADGMVAKDIAAGIISLRSRHGLSLGEVISGKRSAEGASLLLLVKYLYRILPEGDLAGGEVTVVFTLKGRPVFSETISGKTSSPYNRRIGSPEDGFPEFDAHHWVSTEKDTQFSYELIR